MSSELENPLSSEQEVQSTEKPVEKEETMEEDKKSQDADKEDEDMADTTVDQTINTTMDTTANTTAASTTKTPSKKGRGRPKRTAEKKTDEPVKEKDSAPRGGGRKRKTSEGSGGGSAPTTPRKGKAAKVTLTLSWEDFVSKELGDRVLSCGDGEPLGHPGRTTSKKPRKVDIVEEEEMKIRQVVAGGVHSMILTDDHRVFACGINEKGTVPAEGVEPEGSTDEFTEIKLNELIPDMEQNHGKVVMLTAGASFSAAVTDLGSVIAWGNLRDSSGEVDAHPQLKQMTKKPVVVINHKKLKIVKVAAGENHLAMLSEHGHMYTFGEGSMGQLGRTRRTGHIRGRFMADDSGEQLLVKVSIKWKDVLFKNIFAAGYWTAAISTDDVVYTFGLNNYGHLGVPMDLETVKEEDEEKRDEKGEAPPQDQTDYHVYKPTIAPAYEGRKYTHLVGVQHIAARSDDGEVYAIGRNVDNALGLGTWTGNDDDEHWRYTTMQHVEGLPSGKIAGMSATLGATIAWSEDGKAWSWGFDTSGQLGLGIKDDDDKMVPKPTEITSAHLDGYRILSVAVADNHSLFLAKKVSE